MSFIPPHLPAILPSPRQLHFPSKSTSPHHPPTPLMCATPSPPIPALRIDQSWPTFASDMRSSNVIPDHTAWHTLLDNAYAADDEPWRAVWLLNLMRETGRVPTAVTYDKVLRICEKRGDRDTAFLLVEGMFEDKVLLGDVQLPPGMEEVLRKILPPEAFE